MEYQEQIFKQLYLDPSVKTLDGYILYDVGDPVLYTVVANFDCYKVIRRDYQKNQKNIYITVWDPVANALVRILKKSIVQNKQFSPDVELLEKNKNIYIEEQIKNIVTMFAKEINTYTDEQDALYSARVCIKSDYPGLLKTFDELYPDKRDVIAGIERLIRFAIDEQKSPGRTFERDHYIHTANYGYTLLKDRGYTELDGFKEAWMVLTNLYKLPVGGDFLSKFG